MREIKFRAWNSGNNKYWRPMTLEDFTVFNANEFINIEWEQFTGLHDKNGKEIYEGDIIKKYKPTFIKEGIGIAGFYGSEFAITNYPILEDWNHTDLWFFTASTPPDKIDDLEIIGNIHENPELLEK